jgi:hypothetical protein
MRMTRARPPSSADPAPRSRIVTSRQAGHIAISSARSIGLGIGQSAFPPRPRLCSCRLLRGTVPWSAVHRPSSGGLLPRVLQRPALFQRSEDLSLADLRSSSVAQRRGDSQAGTTNSGLARTAGSFGPGSGRERDRVRPAARGWTKPSVPSRRASFSADREKAASSFVQESFAPSLVKAAAQPLEKAEIPLRRQPTKMP